MFGAFLCEPVNKEADFGVMFMDTGGYLNMCGHCTIGAVTVAVEAGLVESHEGENDVVLEAPAGLIRTKAIVKNGKVESVTLTNVPAFVYKENQKLRSTAKRSTSPSPSAEASSHWLTQQNLILGKSMQNPFRHTQLSE